MTPMDRCRRRRPALQVRGRRRHDDAEMAPPDFKAIAESFVCVVKDEHSDETITWQVCIKQDWTDDLDDVEHYDNEEDANYLAEAIKCGIANAMRVGWVQANRKWKAALRKVMRSC